MQRAILAFFALILPLTASLSRAAVTTPLLSTTWGQDGASTYALYSPAHWRLGCWSTAFAQILYYHRLLPHGSVTYDCTDYGYHVSENFNSYSFNWNLFVNSINGSTPQASVQQVAKYSYYAAVTIEKDFGTGDYILSHNARANALEDHYNCTTAVHSAWLLYPISAIEDDIEEELDVGYPVMLHLRDNNDNYHAVAVDGYRTQGGEFQVHINMGHEGADDGWYNFEDPILGYNDNSYRKIVTIRPIPEPSTFVLLSIGALALWGYRRRWFQRS
ncbi:MAG: C10 family peptidase [Pirellulales bacterium]|nr:C10 family peptidase [Pirellulales bacterium]